MTEMAFIPELYQDDEAFFRMRTLQKEILLCQPEFSSSDLNLLLERYNQAFEYSLLPITETEQIQTIETLKNLHPIVWHVIQTINLHFAPGSATEPSSLEPRWETARNSTEAPLLTEPKQQPIKFDGLDYKSYLKRVIFTVGSDQTYIVNKVHEILAPRRWGRPLAREYSQFQSFAEEKYLRSFRSFTIFLVCILLSMLVFVLLVNQYA